jgi:hypothetical protein
LHFSIIFINIFHMVFYLKRIVMFRNEKSVKRLFFE